MFKLVLIFLGAGLGGVARYALGGAVQGVSGESFPAGTLAVNVAGCLVIGFLDAAFAGPVLVREEHRIAIFVGIIGGFTTFSSFGKETLSLAVDGEYLLAGLNVMLSNVLGLGAVWLGLRLGERAYGV